MQATSTAKQSPESGPDRRDRGQRRQGPDRFRLRPSALGRHQLALAAILFTLIPLAGLNAVWSADEGALLYQVASVADGRGWIFDHPMPAADPTGTYFPIHLSSWAPGAAPVGGGVGPGCGSLVDACRYIVLAKHGAFLWLAAALFGLGGYGAIIAWSVAGALAAAIATSRLAALYDPAAAKPALWITGLASPLFVGSYVAWAHAVATALVAWAAYGLLTDQRRSTWRPAGLGLLFAACMLRTEAPLAGLAIGAGLVAVAGFRSPPGRETPSAAAAGWGPCRQRRTDRRLTGAAAIVVSGAGVVMDRMTAQPTDGPVQPVDLDQGFGFVAGRIEAFTITWLQPAYGSDPRDLLLLGAAGSTLLAGAVAGRGPAGSTKTMALLAMALTALLARFAVAPAALVPGLVVAFPVLFFGLLVLDRRSVVEDRLIELLAPFALFCAAVLATQYRHGGGGEWGGRYFMVGLPLGIAAAAIGLVRAGAALPVIERRRAAGLLLASMAVLNTMGLLGLRAVRNQTEALSQEIDLTLDHLADDSGIDTADPVDPPATAGGDERGDRPVVLTTIDGLGRWMWRDVDRGRWLRVPPADLGIVAARLRDLGVDQLVLVSMNEAEELRSLDRWYRPETAAISPGTPRGAVPASVTILRAGR